MWVKLDDGFAEHPKIARVGAVGAWLQVQALCYANRNLTDGFIPQDVAETFVARGTLFVDEHRRRWTLAQTCGASGRDVTEVDWPAIMVDARLWEVVPGGYQIHDYPEYQPSRAQVLDERRQAAARMQRVRTKRRAAPVAAGSPEQHPNFPRTTPPTREKTTDSRLFARSSGSPLPVEDKDSGSGARARATQSGRHTRALRRPDPVPSPDATRQQLAARARTPRSTEPVRLVDLLDAARARLAPARAEKPTAPVREDVEA